MNNINHKILVMSGKGGVGKSTIVNVTAEAAPSHQPGLLPEWLEENGTDVVLAARYRRESYKHA